MRNSHFPQVKKEICIFFLFPHGKRKTWIHAHNKSQQSFVQLITSFKTHHTCSLSLYNLIWNEMQPKISVCEISEEALKSMVSNIIDNQLKFYYNMTKNSNLGLLASKYTKQTAEPRIKSDQDIIS